MDVLTLSPENLILEKIGAYENRRFIRDIYDVYHLSNYVTEARKIRKKTIVASRAFAKSLFAVFLSQLNFDTLKNIYRSQTKSVMKTK